jgi:hypothetical protein
MALIEVFHVVAAEWPINPTATDDIPQGMLVGLDGDGYVVRADTGSTGPTYGTVRPLGLAGDSRSQGTTSYTPESGSALSRNPTTSLEGALVTSAWGTGRRFTQNRVADNYNEVFASGKMTVYHSGGEFWTDQYELIQSDGATICDYNPGKPLYVSTRDTDVDTAPDGVTEYANPGGRFTDDTTGAVICGFVITPPTQYPSGVPGTETAFSSLPEGGNSLAWGTFLHVKLAL